MTLNSNQLWDTWDKFWLTQQTFEKLKKLSYLKVMCAFIYQCMSYSFLFFDKYSPNTFGIKYSKYLRNYIPVNFEFFCNGSSWIIENKY